MTPGIHPLIAGNWKMNGTSASIAELHAIARGFMGGIDADTAALICPPATLLARVSDILSKTPISSGGQDCHAEENGAHTGDISAEMLISARKAVEREGISGKVVLERGDATAFDAQALFGRASFDRVFVSYALSMIPGWEKTIALGLEALASGGSLHVVDFGGQDRLPGWFRGGLRAWLTKFHVAPRDELRELLESEAQRTGASLEFESLFRGYAVHAVMRR